MMFFLTGINYIIRPSSGGFIPDTFKHAMLYNVGNFPIVAFMILVIVAIFGYVLLNEGISEGTYMPLGAIPTMQRCCESTRIGLEDGIYPECNILCSGRLVPGGGKSEAAMLLQVHNTSSTHSLSYLWAAPWLLVVSEVTLAHLAPH